MRFRQVVAEELANVPNWERLHLDDMYRHLSNTIKNAATKVLGITRSRAKPTMTDEIKGLLDSAKELHKEMIQLPPGIQRT